MTLWLQLIRVTRIYLAVGELRSEALLALLENKIVPSVVCCGLIVGLLGFWNLNSTVPIDVVMVEFYLMHINFIYLPAEI